MSDRSEASQFWRDHEAKLRTLWMQTAPVLSAKEIGMKLGLGDGAKNKVLGAVHRLGLPKRETVLHKPLSPGVNAERHRQRGIERYWAKKNARLLAAGAAPVERPAETNTPPRLVSTMDAPVPEATPKPRPVLVVVDADPVPDVKPPGRIEACCYIEGNFKPGQGRKAIYCDAPTVPGKSMCSEHMAICYPKARSVA